MGHERAVVVGAEGGRWNHFECLEEKSVSRMKDLVTQLSKGSQLVVDQCERRFSVGRACVMH